MRRRLLDKGLRRPGATPREDPRQDLPPLFWRIRRQNLRGTRSRAVHSERLSGGVQGWVSSSDSAAVACWVLRPLETQFIYSSSGFAKPIDVAEIDRYFFAQPTHRVRALPPPCGIFLDSRCFFGVPLRQERIVVLRHSVCSPTREAGCEGMALASANQATCPFWWQ